MYPLEQSTINGGTNITGVVTIGENSITLDGRAGIENVVIGSGNAVVSGATTDGKRTFIGIDDVKSGRIFNTGITTTTDLQVGSAATVTGNLAVGGRADITGVASVTSDLYVGGNLNVTGDLVYDEVTGRNLNITGIATFNVVGINSLTVDYANTTDAVGGALTVTNLTVTGDANIGGTGIATVGGDVNFRNVEVSGLSTFTGIVTTATDLYVGGDLYISDDLVFDEATVRNITASGLVSTRDMIVSGVATVALASATNIQVTNIDAYQVEHRD